MTDAHRLAAQSPTTLEEDIAALRAENERLRGLVRANHRLSSQFFPMKCTGCDWEWVRPLGTGTMDQWDHGRELHAAHVAELIGQGC